MKQKWRPSINQDRLSFVLNGINRFGRSPAFKGYDRRGFSDADMEARRWLMEFMAGEGLAVWSDAAANVFGRLGRADEPCVMIGSHLDTVPDGGAFDGALGVAVALECTLALRDAGQPLRHPIEVVATSEEEGRFGGMLGSQAMAGLVSQSWLREAMDADGVRLLAAMEAQGYGREPIVHARREPGSVRAFLELHVEQGPVLDSVGIPVGIVSGVSGMVYWSVTLEGVANHAGTTPMDMRADAFAGLAAIAGTIPGIIAKWGTKQSRITIGKVSLLPNAPHTIPGRAEFSVILRETSEDTLEVLCKAFADEIAAMSRLNGLQATMEERSRLVPVKLDPGLAGLLRRKAEELGIATRQLVSGAGHDSQTMQSLCPSAMIFVPSRGGISHAPDEWTDWPPILSGAELMLAAVRHLVGEV